MSDDQRVFLELKPARQGYEARLHRGDPASSVSLRKLGLGRDARVIVKDGSYALGELIDLLAGNDMDRKAALFDERGQLALGQYLYGETLGKGKAGIGERLRDEDAVLVRVVTEDEDLARLPWALLARGGRFLCATGWSVMLCDTAECADCTLPPSPRILMMMPEPDGVPGTEAGAHIDELEALLSASDPYLERGQHLALVHTWEDLRQALADRRYDLLYYYGHGLGDRDKSRWCSRPDRATPVAIFPLRIWRRRSRRAATGHHSSPMSTAARGTPGVSWGWACSCAVSHPWW